MGENFDPDLQDNMQKGSDNRAAIEEVDEITVMMKDSTNVSIASTNRGVAGGGAAKQLETLNNAAVTKMVAANAAKSGASNNAAATKVGTASSGGTTKAVNGGSTDGGTAIQVVTEGAAAKEVTTKGAANGRAMTKEGGVNGASKQIRTLSYLPLSF